MDRLSYTVVTKRVSVRKKKCKLSCHTTTNKGLWQNVWTKQFGLFVVCFLSRVITYSSSFCEIFEHLLSVDSLSSVCKLFNIFPDLLYQFQPKLARKLINLFCSNEGSRFISRGNNNEIAKIYRKYLKIISRTIRPILT